MLKAVIGELLELAVTINGKKAFDTYSNAKPLKDIRKNLEKMNLSSSILEECAVFRKLDVRDDNIPRPTRTGRSLLIESL